MPDRIIRDELLRSHRFVGLSSDTLRLVFIAFVLCADDLGNAEATPTAVGIMLVRAVPEETAAKWIAELVDADLLRTYESTGKRYVHIPRFRQRLRYTSGKHPRPPSNIECKEIKQLAGKVRPESDLSQTTVRPKTAEVKRSEVKRSEENLKPPARDLPLIVADLTAKLTGNPNPNPGGLKDTKPEKPEGVKSNVNPNWKVPSRDDHQSLDRFAKDAGINPQAFPSYASLQKHLIDLVRLANAEERRHDRQRPIAEAAAQLAHVEVKKEDEAP